MTCIGHEICPHPFGGVMAALVGKLDELQTVRQRMNTQFPTLTGAADTNQQYGFTGMLRIRIGKTICSSRVTNGNAHILPDNMVAQKILRRRIRSRHFGIAYTQYRISNRINNLLISFRFSPIEYLWSFAFGHAQIGWLRLAS